MEFVTATETDVHGDALCFMATTWAGHKTTGAVLTNGWRLAAVGGRRVGGWGFFRTALCIRSVKPVVEFHLQMLFWSNIEVQNSTSRLLNPKRKQNEAEGEVRQC